MSGTERALREFQEYIEKLGDKINDDNKDEYAQQFIREYNRKIVLEQHGMIEKSDEDKAYDLYEEALETYSQIRAKKLLKEAIQLYPDFLDAKKELVLYTQDMIKRFKQLEDLEKEEKERLEKEGYFNQESIGSFYGILETRPYIRLLYTIGIGYREVGAYKKATEVFERVMELNDDDNTGSRFELMGIYAALEDNKKMNKLLQKRHQETVAGFLFQFVLDFKSFEFTSARKHIRKLQKYVPEVKNLFIDMLDSGTISVNPPSTYYRPYTLDEVVIYIHKFPQLFLNEEILEFAIKTLK